MNVLNLKESRNSLVSRLNYLRSHSPNSKFVDRCNTLMTSININLDSYEMYNKFDIQIEKLNTECGDLLQHYDPFDDEALEYIEEENDEMSFPASHRRRDDIEEVDKSDDSSDELDWWEVESKVEKTRVIRFSLPEETKQEHSIRMESMRQITKRIDLYDRIRRKSIPNEISLELKERILDFMKFCNKYMNVEKWFYMKQYIQNRDCIELYDDFKCNRINQQLNECYTDTDPDDVQICIDIDNIDSLHYLFDINKKLDELQHSTILKFAIMYRVENPYFHMIDEIRDLYDMIITSEMNFYRTNLLKMLLELDIEEILDI
jgi:hypothetical protein